MMMLAVYARKSGISKEELETDAFMFMEKFDKLPSSTDNPFTEKDVIDALQAYAIKIGQDNIGILNNKDEIYFWEFEKNKKPTTKIPNKILERILSEFTNSNYKSYDYELER